MINNRQSLIIDLLCSTNEWMIGKELANVVNVSSRTIRLDISTINDFYQDILIESNKRFGYRINEEILHKKRKKDKEIIPQNSDERCIYIIKELLFKSKDINLIELQQKVFVSDYSIDKDIKKIRRILSEYGTLKLVRSKNHISLSGNESDKRGIYKELLIEETKGNFMNLNSIADLWRNFDLLAVKDALEEVCDKNTYKIREMIFPMIMIHAGIAIERIYNNNYITSTSSCDKLKESKEYKISREFFQTISRRINIQLVEDEINLFALLLIGKKSTEYRKDIVKEELNKNADDLVDQVIEKIRYYFDIDFSNDTDLKVGLSMHLQSLIERQKNNIKVTNMYLQEIKRKYPLVFEMAVRAGEVIQEFGYKYVNENELAFVALHLGAAYERVNSVKKHRVIMIIPHNQMLSKMCIDKLNNRFGERMEIIKVYNFFEENQIKRWNPDLIITTAPLIHTLNILTVSITLFVNYEDESKVFQSLNQLDKIKNSDKFLELLNRLMRKDLFYVRNEMNSDLEVIEYLCDQLIEKNLATEEYKKDVLKREEISATSFGYGFAVPHSVEITAKESCISIMILNNPLKWGEYEVKFIVLLAIRELDNNLMKIFFEWLSNIVNDPNKFSKILEIKTHEDLLKEIL